ncbi:MULTISPECIES: sulfate/molybdate ABC transporter ATP-binding protein [unclassified Saccharopolyspora]|uniref:sulfate/molybdate ABC transporter ATP-binding protein n=3 Tax=unclassified Saccharopolyspora TaxID=2646250 RepID=UPI00190D18CC|nr:ATP-binding cassette domain-containing protein [Saccharopolyspora sp. HNM0986]MBK0865730.1 ATP-binding cassette domain-containing protein [Saccharopolyspora sp. HNM0986]
MSGLHAEIEFHRAEFALHAELDVPPGEVLAVLGPNGAGKSTLLSVLSGLLDPDRGRVQLQQQVWCDAERQIHVPTHRRGVGLLAQNALLFPNLTALENVAFGPRAAGDRKAAARQTARHWLAEVDAAELADRKPAQLSGGQAQRVALARALAAAPELLLLDEPLAALDVDAAPAIRGLLHRVLRAQQQPTVLVTHDVLDAVVLADRVAVLVDGRIIEQGPTRDVLARPRASFTARIAGLNLLTGPGADGGLTFDEIAVTGREAEAVAAGESAAAVFAPAAVAVHRERPHASPRNAVPVRLTGLEPRGDVVRLRAETRTAGRVALAADVTPAAVADLGLALEDQVFFVVKATEVAIHPLSDGSSVP